jgi:hypothetical protein
MTTPAAPASPGTDKETLASLRGDVFLEDVGKNLEEQKAADKAAADAAETKRKAEEAAAAQAAAMAALPADPRVKALEEALRISEAARQRAAELARPPAPEKAEEKELSDEELQSLWDKSPMAAIAHMLDKRQKVLEANFEQRFGTLTRSGAATARESAERRYPDEFRILGKEIDAFIATVPNAEQRLSSSKDWDDLIAYIRGQPTNFDKIVKDRDEKRQREATEAAQAREREVAGAHTVSQIRSPAPAGGVALDDTAKEIARTMFPNMLPDEAYAEYSKWARVAS